MSERHDAAALVAPMKDAPLMDRPLRGPELQTVLAQMRDTQPDRAPWPAEWFDYNDPSHAYRCRNLWGEVLRLSLIDVCTAIAKDYARAEQWDRAPPTFRIGPRPEPRPSWVGSSEFHMVAALAGFDGAAIADRVSRKLTSPAGTAELLAAMNAAMRPKIRPGDSDD
jgi:hypothetical protein